MIPFELRPRVENLEELVAILFSHGGESFGRGSEFVFRPGGVAGGNVFTTWPSLYAAYSLVQGTRWIYADDSIAPATVPAGIYNVDLTTFVGNFNSPTETLHFADGAHFVFNTIWLDAGLVFSQDGSHPVFQFQNAQSFAQIILTNGLILSSTATAWAENSNTTGGDFSILIRFGGLGDGIHPAVSTDLNATTAFQVEAGGGVGPIVAHALAGTGTANVIFFADMSGLHPTQDVSTIVRSQPGLNLAEGFNSGGAIGPSATATQATGNITRIRGGKVRVVGAISGVTSVAATVTVTLLRDAVIIGQAVVATQADDLTYASTLQAIDTLPDSIAHTYSIQAASSAGTTTVAMNQARIDADEL